LQDWKTGNWLKRSLVYETKDLAYTLLPHIPHSCRDHSNKNSEEQEFGFNVNDYH